MLGATSRSGVRQVRMRLPESQAACGSLQLSTGSTSSAGCGASHSSCPFCVREGLAEDLIPFRALTTVWVMGTSHS